MQRKPDKPSNLYRQGSSNKNVVRVLYVIIVGLLGLIAYQNNYFQNTHDEMLKSTDEEYQKEIANYKEKEKSLSHQLKSMQTEKESSEEKLHDLENQLKDAKLKNYSADNDKKVGDLEHVVDLITKKNSNLEKEIQESARKEALATFGAGPHKVKFELEFHPDEVPPGTRSDFIAELAPLELMPYTVNFFLKQTKLGLFNGCSFHRNAGHVVQGGPANNHLNPGVNVRKPFKDANLSSVIFQEYHKDFPHKKYTLGYAGRPGGPDFYVSTMDNTRNHGPGGQQSYALKGEADPCFAKVIDGFEAVDRMHKLSVQPGDYKRMKHYVAIKKVTIL